LTGDALADLLKILPAINNYIERRSGGGVIVHLSQVEPVEMVPGVWRRTLVYGDRAMIVHVTLDPGATVPAHSHPHEQVGYVLSGKLSLPIGGVEHSLKSGDSYLIPSNVEHDAVSAGGAEVIDVFSPPREEYR